MHKTLWKVFLSIFRQLTSPLLPFSGSVQIKTSSSLLKTKVGVPLELLCNTSSITAKPLVTWSRGQGSSTYNISYDGVKYARRNNSLVLLNPSIADSDNYTCRAENEDARAIQSFQVFVEGKSGSSLSSVLEQAPRSASVVFFLFFFLRHLTQL